MSQRISILGSGWLGSAVALSLLQSFPSLQVNISTRSRDKIAPLTALGTQPFIIDIDNLEDNIRKFLDADILMINITSKNINAFNKLLEKIKQSPIRKVLFISSTGVYPNHSGLCRESDNLNTVQHPLLTIESLFRDCISLQTTILRFAGLIGGKRHPGRFFDTQRIPAKAIPSPQAPVNLIHLDDCLAIITLIINQNVWGEVLNGCADTHPTKEDFYRYNAMALGLDEPALSPQKSNTNKVICNEKIKACLNYQFIHPDLMKIDPFADYD